MPIYSLRGPLGPHQKRGVISYLKDLLDYHSLEHWNALNMTYNTIQYKQLSDFPWSNRWYSRDTVEGIQDEQEKHHIPKIARHNYILVDR